MKKSKCILTVSSFTLLISSLSAEVYQVKPNDSLSVIIQNNYPDFRIFGSSGMLKKIMSLNPKIKKADLIYVNQKIFLPKEMKNNDQIATQQPLPAEIVPAQVTKQEQAPIIPEKHETVTPPPSTRVISNDQLQSDIWTLKVLYGMKLLSVDQSETLTGVKLSTLATDNLKLESEFKYDNLKFLGSYESHSFSCGSSLITKQTKLSTFEMDGVWNNYLMGFSLKELPLIKATTTSLDLTKESQIGLILGYDKTWVLPTTKPTSIDLRSSIIIPFSASSDKTDTMISSLSGFEIKSNLELSRTIIKREDYSLNLIWQNELGYGKTSRNVVWGSNNGKVGLTKIEAKSLIGIGFSF